MLKKLVAVLLLAGLVLPHSCSARPLVVAWDSIPNALMFGVPVLVTIAYALHQLLPALARFHERNGAALHGLFRAICLVLLGAYVGVVLQDDAESRARLATAVTFVVTGGLLLWQQRRGTKAQRLPLLLLTIVGIATVYAFAGYVGDGMQFGGWLFTGAWLLGVGAEVNGLSGTPAVSHGG